MVHTASARAEARLGPWPHETTVGRLVLVDHRMQPTDIDVAEWVERARARHLTTLRTGALFPPSDRPFRRAGFIEIDRLALLRRPLDGTPQAAPAATTPETATRDSVSLKAMRRWHLHRVADLDVAAFGHRWGNDRAAIEEIRDATPTHRARVAVDRSGVSGMAITGRAGETAYLQRLAVDPDARRRGIARALVIDALRWARRNRQMLVNTSVDNEAAIGLYRSLGFERDDITLSVLELDLQADR
ncbi:MAG: GNAT family N-acetyltransferase [Actinomycetota bacterium]